MNIGMKAGVLVVAILAAIVGLLLNMQGPNPFPNLQSKTSSPKTENVVEISPTPPYPKAVIDETMHRFGVMEQYETRDHAFVIRNEGQAPLKLVGTVQGGGSEYKGPNDELVKIFLSADEISPGKSGTVRLEWKPSMAAERYRHGAQVHTNDPQQQTIDVYINGAVKDKLMQIPFEKWNIEDVRDDRASEITGYLYSPIVKNFNIVSISSTNSLLTAEAKRLSRKEAESLEDRSQEGLGKTMAKSGYAIHVRLMPGLPRGRFELQLEIKTDLRKRKADGTLDTPLTHTVYVTGHRNGPIQIFGPEWLEEKSTVVIGRFDSTQGKKVKLNLFVTGDPEEGLKILKAEIVPKILQVDLQPAAKMKGKTKQYFLTFTFPPGIPRTLGDDDGLGSIILHTNHPHSQTIGFKLQYRAY